MPVHNVTVLGRTFAEDGRQLRVSPAYERVADFEYWDMRAGTQLMVDAWWMSMVFSGVYLVVALVGQRLVKKPIGVRTPLLLWNVALSVFSLAGFARMAQELLYVTSTHGPLYSLCNNSFATEAVTGFWTEMFAWSKLVEFVDTAFLVAKKRPLTPLHLWHHATVYVFTWHACRWHVAAGRWFITMNFAVHGLMYAYFALQALGAFRVPRCVAVCLTSLQIVQMVVGVGITSCVWWLKAQGTPCHHPYENIYFSFLIYSSYMLLFLHFFANAYLRRKPKSA